MIIYDILRFPFLIFEPIQPFVDVLFVPFYFFLVDLRRKGHIAEVLIFDPLLESVCFLAGLHLVIDLRVEELLKVAGASAFAAINDGFEGTISHCFLVDFGLQ
jgi:hypothetical protein